MFDYVPVVNKEVYTFLSSTFFCGIRYTKDRQYQEDDCDMT